MNYGTQHYRLSVNDCADTLTLCKDGSSDWCHLSMDTNGNPNGTITIRSKAMAEALRFMLGQMLSGEDV